MVEREKKGDKQKVRLNQKDSERKKITVIIIIVQGEGHVEPGGVS